MRWNLSAWTAAAFVVPFTTLSAPPTAAYAHAVCGNRVFPATLNVDDPGVGDELSLPTYTYTPSGTTGGQPTSTFGFEWDKTITEHFGFSISDNYISLKDQGVHYQGLDNIDAGLKYEFYCNPDHEFMASIGVDRTFAYTGSRSLINNGYIDSISSTSPTLYVGKGLGDLPIGLLRPLAITGEVSYQLSDRPGLNPNAWNFGATIQYSIPYLQEHVKALGLPEPISRLTPLVEINFNVPNGGPSTGTISPGLLYDADTWQLGVEAVFPINNVTRQQQGIGAIAQVHFFLDDIFPNSLGKPIFGASK
jgi:hypothetical protein